VPTAPPGRPVANLPEDIRALYYEARQSAGVGAYTASVLTCRKMLIDLAVDQQDEYHPGKRFVQYVDYLTRKIFAPDAGQVWLNRIREQGNSATHELGVQTQADAMLLLSFVEMLLRLLYEFPQMLGSAPASVDQLPDDAGAENVTRKMQFGR
jgi:hypothetical protein